MKRLLLLVLVLVMLQGALYGCGSQTDPIESSTEQPATEPSLEQDIPEETEPELSGPPQKAEELAPLLNNALEKQSIPVEFVFAGEEEFSSDQMRTIYQASFADTGVSENFDISVYYQNTISDPIDRVELWVGNRATDRELEMFRTVGAVVSELCDEHMTREDALILLDADTSNTEYAVVTGDIGAFCLEEQYYYPITETIKREKHFYTYCQPKDMTHTVIRYDDTQQRAYRVDMTKEGQKLYAEQETYLTVAELENGINAFFEAEGIPLECEFGGDGYDHMFAGEEVNMWKAHFRFTSWDAPNIQYPVVNTKPYNKNLSHASDPEFAEKLIYENFLYSLTVAAGWHKDTPIVYMYALANPLTFTDWVDESFTVVQWDDSWTEICRQFLMTVCDAWDQTMGTQICGEYAADMFAEDAPEYIHTETEDYTIGCDVYGSGLRRITIRCQYSVASKLLEHEQKIILDPQLLDYTFTFTQPILQDGIFLYNARGVRYRTDTCGDSYDWSGVLRHVYDFCDNRFLEVIGSKINYGTYENPIWVSCVCRNKGDKPDAFDSEFADWESDSFEGMGEQMFCLSYNRSVNGPVDVDYVVAFGVVLSQVCDEGMTVEEAIALQTEPQEVALVCGDWQISYLAPRGVSHILCQNTVTGQTRYYVLPTLVFETSFVTLEAFAELRL